MRIRQESDIFRENLISCWDSSFYSGNREYSYYSQLLNEITWEGNWTTSSSNSCIQLRNTLIWKKRQYIQQAVSWFAFHDTHIY